jgi:hypothetical protein
MSIGGRPLQIDKVKHSALPPRRWKQKTMEFIVTRNAGLHHCSPAINIELGAGTSCRVFLNPRPGGKSGAQQKGEEHCAHICPICVVFG